MRYKLGKYLSLLSAWSAARPKLTLLLLLLTSFVCLLIGAFGLKLRLEWTYLFHADDPVVGKFEEARDIFPYPGDVAVLVDQGTKAEREQFLDLLGSEMAKQPDVFFHVMWKLDLRNLSTKALYFLSEEQLAGLARVLDKNTENPEALVSEEAVKLQLRLLSDLKAALETRGRNTPDPIWETFASESSASLNQTLSEFLEGRRQFPLTIAKGRVHVLVYKGGTKGSKLVANGSEVVAVRELLKRLEGECPGLRVRITGLPVMLYDERRTCTRDSFRSGALSFIAILLVFALGFGGWRKACFSLMSLSVGLAWTMAYAALTVGHLNLITVTMVSMLMGLGIDFSIHFLFRFEEEFEKTTSMERALEETSITCGVDTLVGACATSASFLALTAASFRGVSDLGVLASGGILLCFFSTFICLPALLALDPKACQKTSRQLHVIHQIETRLIRFARPLTLFFCLVTALALALSTAVGFNHNLLSIQDPSLASVQTELDMLRDYQTTALGAAVLVKGREKAIETANSLRTLPSVASVTNLADLLPPTTESKQVLVERVVKLSNSLKIPAPVALDRAEDLSKLKDKIEDMETGNLPRDPAVEEALDEVMDLVSGMSPGPIQDSLKSFQNSVLEDFTKLVELLKSQRAEPVTEGDLPEGLLVRYLAEDIVMLSVQPAHNIWNRQELENFVNEPRSKGVEMVGHAVSQAHILESFDQAFRSTPLFTLVGVFSVMLLYLRRPTLILLASLPTALGVTFIFGIMGALGMKFNIVNFVALPISVGIGAVYGVHALHRLQDSKDGRILSSSTAYGILLSALTTMAGFASLMTAHHRGLSSFGFVICLGVMTNLLVSLVILPSLMRSFGAVPKADLKNGDASPE